MAARPLWARWPLQSRFARRGEASALISASPSRGNVRVYERDAESRR